MPDTIHAVMVGKTNTLFMTHEDYERNHPQRARVAQQIHAGRRDFPCPGALRIADPTLTVVTIQCDVCGARFGCPQAKLDRARLVQDRLDASRIPLAIATKSYDKHTGNEAARAVCRMLIERWGTDHQPHPPFVVGPTGRGKTHLLAMTARELVMRNLVGVRYWAVPDLLASARRRMDSGFDDNAEAFIAKQTDAELLILDDLGAENTTGWALEVIQRIVDAREQLLDRPIMGATNVPPEAWDDAFGDRTASRLRGMTTLVEVTGDDYRERDTTPATAGNVTRLDTRRNAPSDQPPTDA